jgi:hypothetical protein
VAGVPARLHAIKTLVSQLPDTHGTVRPEYHLQLMQRRELGAGEAGEAEPRTVWGGSTVILDADGRVRYVIARRVDDEERLERQRDYLAQAGGAFAAYGAGGLKRISLAALHRGF